MITVTGSTCRTRRASNSGWNWPQNFVPFVVARGLVLLALEFGRSVTFGQMVESLLRLRVCRLQVIRIGRHCRRRSRLPCADSTRALKVWLPGTLRSGQVVTCRLSAPRLAISLTASIGGQGESGGGCWWVCTLPSLVGSDYLY